MKLSAAAIVIASVGGMLGGQTFALADDSRAMTFETTIDIKRKKSDLVICSEGAATGEQLETSMASCNAAIEQSPDSGDGYFYRGYVYFHLGQMKEAEEDFTAAIAKGSSREAESYYQRGVCKERQRRLREAAADFKAAAALKPGWSQAQRKVDEYQWAYE